MTTQTDLTVRKSVVVNCSPEVAFHVFTECKTDWWPYETHAASGEKPAEVIYEPRVGGRVFDRLVDGRENQWGTVLAWEPPHRLVLAWEVSPSVIGTEVEIRFLPEEDGTRVELEHGGWEHVAAEAPAKRDDYADGWDFVLSTYVERA